MAKKAGCEPHSGFTLNSNSNSCFALSFPSLAQCTELPKYPQKNLWRKLSVNNNNDGAFDILNFSGALDITDSDQSEAGCTKLAQPPFAFHCSFVFQSMLNSLMSFFKGSEEVPQVDTHWMSESGIIDVFVMLGPRPHDVFREYASFTGTTALPPVSCTCCF